MKAANAAHGELAVRLDGVRFGWGEGDALLDIEYLEVRRGERILVRGASGSGKTTLLGLLGGVLVPQRGRIDVAGTRISALGAAARDRFRADHIGFVFQQFNLLPYLTVRENVLLPLAFSRRRATVGAAGQVEALLAQLGLDARAVSDRPVTELSIGQQQRVAVARALIGGPELLIADEPTSALDADAREAFLRVAFAECARVGATLVFVSHDRGLVPLFDRAIALDDINLAAKNRSTCDARLAAGT